MIGEQSNAEQYSIQMENMYSYLSTTLAHDFGLLSLEDDDYLWLYENAMPPIYSTSRITSRSSAMLTSTAPTR